MIISIVNRKGGTAKTTSTAYLATVLKQADFEVTALDTDPDRSLMKWYETGSLPFKVQVCTLDDLATTAKSLGGYVIIDTPPNDQDAVYEACEVADEVIIPLAATALDAGRLATTLKAVLRTEKAQGKELASILLVRYSEHLSISKDALEAFERDGIPFLDSKIRNLTRYQSLNITYLDEYKAVLEELGVIGSA